jgi:mannan endo-1,4-beta-mannosidase
MFWIDDPNVPLSVLDEAIGNAVANKLVVIVGLWEATGKWQNMDKCIDYWLRDDVKAMVKKYEKYFMLNIVNEGGDETLPEADWEEKYIEAVKKLRNAGYRVPLMIDPANWGRGENYIINCGERVLATDPLRNIIFSWHPWDIDQPTSRYTKAIRASLDRNLCMIVGEFSHLGANYEGVLNWSPLVEECNKYGVGWLWWSWYLPNDKHNIVDDLDTEQKTEWGEQILLEMNQMSTKARIFK